MPNEESENGINVTSYFQSGGITAQTVNFGRPRRQVDQDFADGLLKQLRLHVRSDRPVNLMLLNGYDDEMLSLYEQIRQVIVDSGLPLMDGFTTFQPSNPVRGVKINLVDLRTVALMIGPPED